MGGKLSQLPVSKKVVTILLFNQNLDIFNRPFMDGRAN